MSCTSDGLLRFCVSVPPAALSRVIGNPEEARVICTQVEGKPHHKPQHEEGEHRNERTGQVPSTARSPVVFARHAFLVSDHDDVRSQHHTDGKLVGDRPCEAS